jgi:hypothetical protein
MKEECSPLGTEAVGGLDTTNVSEVHSVFLLRVERISELEITLEVACSLLVTRTALIISTLKMEAIHSSERPFKQDPYGVTSQKTAFFIVAAVKTSNLT